MSNPRLQTRVKEPTKEEVEEYQERRGHPTQAAAVRELILEGMEAKSQSGENTEGVEGFGWTLIANTGSVLAALSIAAFAAWWFTALVSSSLFVFVLAVATIIVNGAVYLHTRRESGLKGGEW